MRFNQFSYQPTTSSQRFEELEGLGLKLSPQLSLKRQFEDGIDAVKILSGITVVSAALAMVFSLIMLANNLSQEYSKGTIKFLYTRPKSRSAILTAKIVLAFINYIIFLVVGTVFDFLTKYYGEERAKDFETNQNEDSLQN